MTTYLVRTIDTHKLVGVLVASSMKELVILIDEEVDPGICEYTKLRGGSGVFMDGIIKSPDERDVEAAEAGEDMDAWEGDIADITEDPDLPCSDNTPVRTSEQVFWSRRGTTKWTPVGCYHEHAPFD